MTQLASESTAPSVWCIGPIPHIKTNKHDAGVVYIVLRGVEFERGECVQWNPFIDCGWAGHC